MSKELSRYDENKIDDVELLIDHLDGELRVELFSRYCRYCGVKLATQPSGECHCTNDE